MLLAHGTTGICPMEVAGIMSFVASAGGMSVLWGLLKAKLGLA